MRIDLIPAGDNPPHEINVLIEVPIGGEPVWTTSPITVQL